MLLFTAPLLLGALGCVHHASTGGSTPAEFLAREHFRSNLDDDLAFHRDGTAWFMPGGTADYWGDDLRWHRLGPAIVVDQQDVTFLPERVAMVEHEGREYLVPWAPELCQSLPTVDWVAVAAQWETLSRPTDPAQPIPPELDVCARR